jgi:hypothetical protein
MNLIRRVHDDAVSILQTGQHLCAAIGHRSHPDGAQLRTGIVDPIYRPAAAVSNERAKRSEEG